MNPPVNDYAIKDTHIRLFTLEKQTSESGEVLKKKYQHPENTIIHSYVRQLSASETSFGNANQDGSSYLFVVTRRSITSDMYIEVVTGPLKGLTMQIDGPDAFELRSKEIKLYTHQIPNVTYTSIEYGSWLK